MSGVPCLSSLGRRPVPADLNHHVRDSARNIRRNREKRSSPACSRTSWATTRGRATFTKRTSSATRRPANRLDSTPLPKTPKKTGDGLLYSGAQPVAERVQQISSPPPRPTNSSTLGAIAKVLAEQTAWTAALSAGTVSGYIEGNQVTINNSGASAVSAPLTGVTGVGAPYGGITSGWASVPVATSTHSAPTTWPVGPRASRPQACPKPACTAPTPRRSRPAGAQPLRVVALSGLVPAGLSLNATSGAITGTPSGTGTSSFTVKLTDSSAPTPRP